MSQVLENEKEQKIKRVSIYLLKIIMVILCGFLSSYFVFKDLNILLTIPLFSFCFFTGIDFFLYCILGMTIGNILNYNQQTFYVAIAICIYFMIYLIFRICKVKSILNHTFSATLAIFFTYFTYQIITHSIFLLDLAIVLTLAMILNVLFSFIIHTFPLRTIVFQNENAFIISTFLLAIYITLIPIDLISITLLRLLFLISAIKVSLKSTLAMAAAFYLSIDLIHSSFGNEIFLMVIPALIVAFIKERKKWLSILLYATTSVLFIFLLNHETLRYELIETGCSVLLLSFFPQSLLRPMLKEDYFYEMYLKNKQEIALKLTEFSNMFETLSNQFLKSKRSRILQQANIEVFDKLCANCFKNQYCHQNGNHLLINYVKDGILNQLNENKINYIKQNCLKADAYLKLIDNFMHSYLLKKFENDEICILKDVVSHQFLGFSKIMQSYKENFLQDKLIVANAFYKNIKGYLEDYHYDVLYVNNFTTPEYYQFDIAISNCKTEHIKEKIIPIINSLLKCQMEIIDIHLHNLVSNYIVLSLKETRKQALEVYYRQNSKESTSCGDSILQTHYLNKFYLAISDGMGNGIEAKEESTFTIEALFSTIKTGMQITEGIAITNSLLKLKNQYDTYTTIDLIEIDQTNLVAKFYKAGAFLSLIIRGEEIYVIENYALPIGIIDQVQIYPYIIQLQKNDVILLMSDGVIDEFNDEIKAILLSIHEKTASILNKELYEKLLEIKQIKDDATFATIVIH